MERHQVRGIWLMNFMTLRGQIKSMELDYKAKSARRWFWVPLQNNMQ